jgi:hypothetical protein
MIRIIFISSIFLFSQLNSFSQEKIKLFYCGKKITSDSLLSSQCKGFSVVGEKMKIKLFKNKIVKEQAVEDVENAFEWKDSVVYTISISKNYFDKCDSVSLTPIYHITYVDSSRGNNEIDHDGKDEGSKNITLRLISNPANAEVFLIPTIIWEKSGNVTMTANESKLDFFRVKEGETPTQCSAQEYTYVVLFRFGKEYRQRFCSPTYLTPDQQIYADFNTK